MRGITITMIVILVLAGAMLAQEDAPLDGVTILPIETIVDEDFEITNFASDGTAVLELTTSVPVACSIVYGTTEAFGSVSVDQDMAGGAHTDHQPLLSGLEEGATYFYRVQGVDADGNIYISEVMTFEVPEFEDEPVENLLAPERGAEIVGYSSAFGGAEPDARWGVNNAVDGSPNTEWSSDGDGDDAWIEFELAERSSINRVVFWTRLMSDGSSQVFSFTLTTDEGETYGPFEVSDAEQATEYEVDIVAETLRFDVVDSSGGNTGAVEIAVYGEEE
jgi:hypothetical protein